MNHHCLSHPFEAFDQKIVAKNEDGMRKYALTPNDDTSMSNYCALHDIIIQTYKSLLTSPQAVYNGINFINEAFATILQYPKQKVINDTLLQALPEEGLEGIQCKCKCSQTKIQCQSYAQSEEDAVVRCFEPPVGAGNNLNEY